jgi:N-methylhydantoinase A
VRSSRPEPEAPPPRKAWFGERWIETPVLRRSELARPRTGPLIIEEYDATCVVEPDARAELDAGGNILIELD